jgi:hypothetical protein
MYTTAHRDHDHQSSLPTSYPVLLFHLADFHLGQLDTNVRHITANPPGAQGHAIAVHDSLGLGPPLLPQELLLAHTIARTAWQTVVAPVAAVALPAGRRRER